MKRFALVFLLPACGGEPGPAGGTLTTGSYVISRYEPKQDDCEVAHFLVEGDPLPITITGDRAEVELFPGFAISAEITHTTLFGELETSYDWNPEHDCVESDLTRLDGEIPGDDAIDLVITASFEIVEGTPAACRTANGGTILPCTSRLAMRLEKP